MKDTQFIFASRFISIDELVELGFSIPKDTRLVDNYGNEVGYYIEHTVTKTVNFHTCRNENYKSFPVYTQAAGIKILVPIGKADITKELQPK